MVNAVLLIKQTRRNFIPDFSTIVTDAAVSILGCRAEEVYVNILEFDAQHFGVGGVLACDKAEDEEFCTMFVFVPDCELRTKQELGMRICAEMESVNFPAVNSRISFHDYPAQAFAVGGVIQ